MRRLHTGFTSALLLLAGSAPPAARPAPATPIANAAACTAPEYRQFDFFEGDWDTYDIADPRTVVARNRVTPMVDGCAIREVYEQTDGMRGESFSTWDAARNLWHQSWVTNRGELLLLDGRLEGDHMVLTARDRAPDGTLSLVRVAWWREGDAVRERAERSVDGAATWKPVFDIVFRPHAGAQR